jgi:ATP-binding cassette, subfamily F, member 3
MPSNFLLLDEPTNHLDMRAKDVLLTALQEYTGTVVFVSHDRYFIDRLATRVIEIEDGRVTVFPGNYEDYLWRKQGGGSLAEAGKPASAEAMPETALKPADKRVNPIKVRQMEERRKAIEEEVARLEARIADYEAALAQFVSIEETRRNTELVEKCRSELTALLSEWEDVTQQLEA